MSVLGINAYHGDASAALVVNGTLVAAAEEERFNRVKHTAGFPSRAIEYCLEAGGLRVEDLDHIAVSRDPSAHLHKKILFALTKGLRPGHVKERLANAGRVRDLRSALADGLGIAPDRIRARMHAVEHHRAHMASAFLVSPFDEAACLSIDGFGDYLSAMWGVGRGTKISVVDQVEFPHSLGQFYTAVTQYLGFPKYGDEYKVMGLAPYGRPEYLDDFRSIVRVGPNGYRLDLDYFLHHSEGVPMVWDNGSPEIGRIYSDAFVRRFGPVRIPTEPLDARHMNLAASVQALAEEVYFHVLNLLHAATRLKRICLAGGVAYNSVANGKIRSRTPFDDVFIQPAAGDAGTALGAAFAIWHQETGAPRSFVMKHSSWGPEYDEQALTAAVQKRAGELRQAGASLMRAESDQVLCDRVAAAIADGKVVGWFQGRMELGARALGHRSILADPRRAGMKDILNERIKRRESFRPFCPSILESHVDEYFEDAHHDPFMLSVYPIKADKQAAIPAVTHVDGTGRLQSVREDEDPLYWRLITSFYEKTGVPVVLNTSFNENEPIVRTPDEALDCFLRTRMDVLAVGRHVIERVHQASGGAGSMKWNWNDSLVVVTGGASFIGSHLVDALVERGASVRVVDNLSSGRLANIDQHVTSRRVEFIEADLKDPGVAEEVVSGARVVFHLAADHGGRGYVDLHQAACATNLMLDGLVFHACHKAKVEKVVYASSGCVYPNHLQTDVNQVLYLTEDMVGPPYDADNMYGWAKLMAEMTLRSYYNDWGMKSASCRYFTVYGDRGHENHAVIAMIARAFVQQSPFVVWGNGEQIRNWTHVSDIVSGTILAAERIDDGRAINLGTMERTRVIDAVQEVMRYTGHHAEVALHPEMPTGPMNRVAENSLARQLLQWEPQVKFMDGLRRTIDWYFASKQREQISATLATRLTER